MNSEMIAKVERMLEGYLVLEKAFKWEHNLTKHFAALVLTSKEIPIGSDGIKSALEVIKSNTAWHSHFRGSYRFMLASLMVAEEGGAERIFAQILQNEDLLKNAGFKQGTHMPMAAYTLHKLSEDADAMQIADTAYGLYMSMKKSHPWLTGSDDYAMSLLLAKSGCDINRVETLYNALAKQGFTKGNDLQRLSHILALSDSPVETLVDHCLTIKRKMKENKLTLYATYYTSLGIIAHILGEDQGVLQDWMDLTHHMNKMKKYKWLGKGMNLMLASAVVSYGWLSDDTISEVSKITLGISVETLIAAQTVAIITASTAAVAASSSST